MKLKLSFVILILLLTISACKKEKVGGACEYIDITKKMSVTFIDGAIDSIFMVSFQPIGIETDEVYRLESKKLKGLKPKFELSDLQNKDNTYTITIQEISKGSCVPFVITKIELDN